MEDVTDGALGPGGELAAVVREGVGTATVEFPPGEVRLTTGGMVRDLRLSPSGRRLAFAHSPQRGHEWGPIVVLDRDGGETRLSQEAGHGLAWTPDEEELWYVTKPDPARLGAITLDGEVRTVATFPTWIHLFDLDRSGRVLLSTERHRQGVVGHSAGTGTLDLSWLSWSVPFDVAADGRTILLNECAGRIVPCRVALRGFDSSPPVVLHDADFGIALSPDGQWVLAVKPWDPRAVGLISTSTDEVRTLPVTGLDRIDLATWLPASDAVLLAAKRPGEGNRVFRLELDRATPEPVTPEGVAFGYIAASPDGGRVAVPLLAGGIAVYDLTGGDPMVLDHDGQPIRWSADGRSLFTVPLGAVPAPLRRLDLESGAAELVATLMPDDPAGIQLIGPVSVTPDGATWVHGYSRRLSDLFVVEGLR